MYLKFFKMFISLFFLFFVIQGHAAVIHDESLDGDLSGSFSTPSMLNFIAGTNTVSGQAGNNGNTGATNGSDADYFSFSIASGFELTSINVDSYSQIGGTAGNLSFLGYNESSAFNGQGGGDVDGFVLFNATSGEILDDVSGTNAVGVGDYAIWIQETGNFLVDYSLSFEITAVPIPPAMLLFVSGLSVIRLARKI